MNSYKGTPNRAEHVGDFKILKKAHITSWKQKYDTREKCFVCSEQNAVHYVKEIDTNMNKKSNVCLTCLSFFID